jgi:hypothetical protein
LISDCDLERWVISHRYKERTMPFKPPTLPKPYGAYFLNHHGTLLLEEIHKLGFALSNGDYMIWGRAFFGNQSDQAGGFMTCSLTATFLESGVQFAQDHLRLWIPPTSSSDCLTSRLPVSLMLGVKTDYPFQIHMVCDGLSPGLSLVASSIKLAVMPVSNLDLKDVGFGASG